MIIGVDPGKMVGMFIYHTDLRCTIPPPFPSQTPAEQYVNALDKIIGSCITRYGVDSVHIAVEKYIITSRTAKLSQQTDALEITGAVKAIAMLHGVTDVRQYEKANLKFASDDMLRGVGWYSPKLRHANDAARQAFALLKDVDYPRWSELVRDAKMEPTTEG
jgi:hypothetical protein